MDEEGNPLYGDVFGLTMEADEDDLVRCWPVHTCLSTSDDFLR